MTQVNLSVQYRPLASLQFDPQNPRQHSKRQIRQIARSIENFGFNVPALVDSKGRLIAGHGRALAAHQLGMTSIPTITIDHLTEPQVRAFMIADNRLTENSNWDSRMLAEQLENLSTLDLHFSVDVTGFEMGEIDLMIEGLARPASAKVDPADAIPDSVSKAQISRSGDLWLLGRHRLLCGDGTKEHCFSALMKGGSAAMVFADPPYNDPIDGYVSGFGKIHHAEFSTASGEMTEGEFTIFLATAIKQLSENSSDGSLHFICMDWRHCFELLCAARGVYSEFKNLCVWVKHSGGQGSLYRSQHELVFVFKKGTRPHRNNIQLGEFGRYRTNVWQYHRVSGISGRSDENHLANVHPTIKPVELVADAILDCTARGDIVLDSFAGSGTTLMAAERTGRTCYGIELEPRYVDTIVRRWQAFTGQKAVSELSGESFSDLEGNRNG